MSALRQLLMAIWAAVWLRWRLVVVKGRRLLGGRPAAIAGTGYQLPAAELPVEGIDYEVGDLPAELTARLEHTRAELVDHARGTAARRTRRRRARRRRTASLTTAALVTLAVLGAGATALVTGSTGIPAIDRVLGIYENELDGRAGSDQQPRASGTKVSIEVPARDGSPRVATAFYVARDGQVCSAVADAGGPGVGTGGSVACLMPDMIAGELERNRAYAPTVGTEADAVVVRGFVDGDVVRLRGRGPDGALDVRLGQRWRPNGVGLAPLRPFVAVADLRDADGAVPEGADRLRILDPSQYLFEGLTGSGDRFQIPR